MKKESELIEFEAAETKPGSWTNKSADWLIYGFLKGLAAPHALTTTARLYLNSRKDEPENRPSWLERAVNLATATAVVGAYYICPEAKVPMYLVPVITNAIDAAGGGTYLKLACGALASEVNEKVHG